MAGEPQSTKKGTEREGRWVVISLGFHRVPCLGGGSTKSPMFIMMELVIFREGCLEGEISGRVGNEGKGLGEGLPCMVTHIARVWINRVRLPILLVVS